MEERNKLDLHQLLMNGILIVLLVFLIFKPSDNSKLERLIQNNNNKIDSLKTKVTRYEIEKNESKKGIDSVNITIGILPDL